MTKFDSYLQRSFDGPLSPQLSERFRTVREKNKSNTLEVIGRECGLSGAFMSNLLRNEPGASIRTRHLPRLVEGLERLEAKEGIMQSPKASEIDVVKSDDSSLEDLVRIANAKGFAVSFSPLAK